MTGPDETIVPGPMLPGVGLDRSGWAWSHLPEPLDSTHERIGMSSRFAARLMGARA
jgi:hypothetical protein